MKPSELIDRLYRSSGIDFKAIHNKYKAPLAFGAGAITAGALTMPKSEKKLLADSLARNQERFPEYDPLSTMASKVLIPGAVGSVIGAGAGVLAAKKGFGKKFLEETMKKEKSQILRPVFGRISDRFGEEKLRMAGGAFAGYELGDTLASLPFEVQQAKSDYGAGLKRYQGNKLRAGVSASSPWTFNAGMYAAEKMPGTKPD